MSGNPRVQVGVKNVLMGHNYSFAVASRNNV